MESIIKPILRNILKEMLFKGVFLELKSIWRNTEDLKKNIDFNKGSKGNEGIEDIKELSSCYAGYNFITNKEAILAPRQWLAIHERFFVFVCTNIAMSVYIYIMCKRDDDGKDF